MYIPLCNKDIISCLSLSVAPEQTRFTESTSRYPAKEAIEPEALEG
jgi:hypothetical protein